MHTVVKRVSRVSVMIILGCAMALATKFTGTRASGSSAPTGSPVASTGEMIPVELGASQEAGCKRTPPDDRIEYEECTSAKRLVAVMNAEPRDKPWADKTESDLSEMVESRESEGFTLRNVQCRSSFCIVEVGSTQSRIFETGTLDQRKWKLFDFRSLFAPDVDDPSVQDQVIFYKRYCSSAGELLDGNGHLVPKFYTMDRKC